MVKMADVEETTSDAADLPHSHDVKKDSHGKMDNADVGNDHDVVSIHKVFKVWHQVTNICSLPYPCFILYINAMFYSWNFRRENMSYCF